MATTKLELEERKKVLEDELKKISKQLSVFDFEEKRAKYGKEFNCNHCKYNALQDFSFDGWHNLCGGDNCTCCHSVCETYEPDNEVTLYIKQNIRASMGRLRDDGYIRSDEYHAIKELAGDIFDPRAQSDKIIKLLNISLRKENSDED